MIENNSDLATAFNFKKNFKVVDKKAKKFAKTQSKSNYTLNCEKRIGQFKEEFVEFFDNKLEQKNIGFENHYKGVLHQVDLDRKFQNDKIKSLETNLKNQRNRDQDKGTLFFMDTDVLQSDIRNLSEEKMIQMYGDWIVDS